MGGTGDGGDVQEVWFLAARPGHGVRAALYGRGIVLEDVDGGALSPDYIGQEEGSRDCRIEHGIRHIMDGHGRVIWGACASARRGES